MSYLLMPGVLQQAAKAKKQYALEIDVEASRNCVLNKTFDADLAPYFSFEIKIKPSSVINYNNDIGLNQLGSWGIFKMHAGNNGVIYIGTSVGSRFTLSDTFIENEIQTFSFVYDDKFSYLYKDGELIGSKASDVPSAANGVRLRDINAIVYDLRVWGKALTENEIVTNLNKKLAGTESDLLLYYDFQKRADASILYDLAGNNHADIIHGEWVEL